MDEDLRLLENEYCPCIDPALVYAIFADYAGSPDAVQLAKQSLDVLKQTALAEQTTDFDPSGSSGDAVASSSSKSGTVETDSNAEEWVSQTTEDSIESGCFRDSEYLDLPTKELLLAETFPTLRFGTVAHILKTCDGNLSKATEELLNHVFFAETETSPTEEFVVPKGIDAFSEEHLVPQRRRKGKGGGKRKLQRLLPASESDVYTPPTNHWLNGSQNIDFIASRANVSSATVASLYHRNGASLSATIKTLIEQDLAANEADKEPTESRVHHAIELIDEYPSIDFEHAIALIRLTAPSTTNAHELAKAMIAQPPSTATQNSSHQPIRVLPQYTPVRLSDDSETPPNLPSLPPSALPQNTASLSAARSAAFTQASSAYRRGKSTPHMKAVAGYYSQLGRDYHAHIKSLSESDADALVASQSSSLVLDLHGVSVASATRIAKERTQAWWDGLGEARIPGGGRSKGREGFRIITGLGRHSEGGRGKLGPAVVRTLVKEGWKIEVGEGEVVVLGAARRR